MTTYSIKATLPDDHIVEQSTNATWRIKYIVSGIGFQLETIYTVGVNISYSPCIGGILVIGVDMLRYLVTEVRGVMPSGDGIPL